MAKYNVDWDSPFVFPSYKAFIVFITMVVLLTFAIATTTILIEPNYFDLTSAILYWIFFFISVIFLFKEFKPKVRLHG